MVGLTLAKGIIGLAAFTSAITAMAVPNGAPETLRKISPYLSYHHS